MESVEEKSFIMAKRMKQLREENGLSHERLSKTLFDQYGIKISSDSPINYEVADANHTKAYKNQGMRVEYLRYLADFYGVSADYLLGLSSARSSDPEISMAVKCTGLTEDNIIFLHNPSVAMGRGATVPKFNSLIHTFVNDVLDICREEGLHNEFQIMQHILARINGAITPTQISGLPSFESVDEYIRSNGLFLLPAKDGAEYYAKQIGDSISQGIAEKYVHPRHRDVGCIDDI